MSSQFEHLQQYGWDAAFAAHFQPFAAAGFSAGRVALEYNQFYRVYTAAGEILAETTGKLRHEAASRADLPAVGDWVALRQRADQQRARIHAVLPRRSKFSRKTVGAKTEEQIVGANIDTVFLMTSLNQDFNPRRVERYLSVVRESGARPVIVLSKADLCGDVSEQLAAMECACADTPIHAISAKQQQGVAVLQQYFTPGQTVAVLGSSGVGKSTLINHLLGYERQQVKEVRADDDRGQHATRHRELILLPNGGLVLDTPGMRELQLWEADEGLEQVFDDIEALAAQCYFSNCQHQSEPRCAVRAALDNGALEPARFENYEKLRRELAHLERRQDAFAQKTERNRWKKLTRQAEERAQTKRKGG